MPIAAFKPPGVVISSPWVTEEWIVFNDATSSRLRYWKIMPASNSFSALTDIATPYTSSLSVGTNGTFVFLNTAAGPVTGQYAWNGSTLTQRYNATPPSGSGGNNARDYYFQPNNPGIILGVGIPDFTDGVQAWSFQSAPTYSYGAAVQFDPSGAFQSALDMRVGAVGTPVYGNTFLGEPVSTGGRMDAMSFSGTTGTSHANLTIANWGGGRGGADRDTGLIALRGSSGTTVYMAQMNMTTRALSAIGNGTITGTTLMACTAHKGFVVTYENTGKIRSYSRSGSTLTQVSVIDLGGTPDRGGLRVSPFTNLIYLISVTSGQSRVLSLSDAGVLTSVVTLTGVTYTSGGALVFPLVWLKTALPTV